MQVNKRTNLDMSDSGFRELAPSSIQQFQQKRSAKFQQRIENGSSMTRVRDRKQNSFISFLTFVLKPVPVALILFFLVIFLSEAPSLASFANNETEKTSFSVSGFFEKFKGDESGEIEFIEEAASEEKGGFQFNLMQEARELFAHYHSRRGTSHISPEEAVKYNGLVEFLSGLISVYYPKEEDPGSIARDIVQISLEEDADPIYIAALIASESSFRKNAKSRVGARGLMQLMPATARIVARQTKFPGKRLSLTDPKTNIRLGVRYINQLEKNYKGNRFKALAAYNWGPGNVGKATRKGKPYPKSVRGYANKIIKRRGKWESLFKNAKKRASEFESKA